MGFGINAAKNNSSSNFAEEGVPAPTFGGVGSGGKVQTGSIENVYVKFEDCGQTEAINDVIRLRVNEFCSEEEMMNIIKNIVSTVRTRYSECSEAEEVRDRNVLSI